VARERIAQAKGPDSRGEAAGPKEKVHPLGEGWFSIYISAAECFSQVPDPRKARGKRHLLKDILAIMVCAIICGADSFTAIADYAYAEQDFLKTFLELPHGVPTADTFERLASRLDPHAFEVCIQKFMQGFAESARGQVIAIDGKTLRRSFDAASKTAAIHMVSAFVENNHLVLGQVATQEKSNEITAIPQLLEMVDVAGSTVTIDAMGCQRAICEKIIEKKADYVVAVKENQPTLAAKVKTLLDEGVALKGEGMQMATYREVEKRHGRTTTRTAYCTSEVDCFRDMEPWPGMRSAIMVEAVRQVTGKEPTRERRYYISSFDGTDAKLAAQTVRKHWGIENKLHWMLDVCMGEDASRIRKGHAAQNFSRLRRMAKCLLERAPNPKPEKQRMGLNRKRAFAARRREYLLQVLQS
jgi:predicted transposase YbfD/YdcC